MRVIIIILLLLTSCEEERTHSAITSSKLSGGEVGTVFDQKTGDTVAIMYKGKSFVPMEERDSLTKELNATITQHRNIVTQYKRMVNSAWLNGYLLAWSHKYDNTPFNEQMKKDSIWFSKTINQ